MKTNKEKIFEFLCMHAESGEQNGVSTGQIAQLFNIKRANVSSILNSLVSDNLVKKKDGRPVRYFVDNIENSSANGHFSVLTGCNGSLQHAIRLAKAAILYPQKSLDSIIIGAGDLARESYNALGEGFIIELNIENRRPAILP